MVKIGHSLSSEERTPAELLKYSREAENSGFTFGLISDHFHPWIDHQGSSPFVWPIIGGISQVTEKFRLGTGVTCPIIRMSPALIAQAAATAAVMMPDRFFLGLGTGEFLNEHVVSDRWPAAAERLEMLEEAISIVRKLWKGGWHSHRGRYYQIEHARIFTLPSQPPPIFVAASADDSAQLAGRCADGLISTSPEADILKEFERAGGKGKPKYGHLMVCYADDEGDARKTVKEFWPTSALEPPLMTDLMTPRHFEKAVEVIREDKMVEGIVLGADPKKHLDAIDKYVKAGFDHVYLHQIGPDQEGFFKFYREQILPNFALKQNGSKRSGKHSSNGNVSNQTRGRGKSHHA